jgi:hypothetical protein
LGDEIEKKNPILRDEIGKKNTIRKGNKKKNSIQSWLIY